MNTLAPAASFLGDVPVLLRGETEALTRWLGEKGTRRELWCVAMILAGAGLYGASVGCWRAPGQALYTAIKFPLILLLTAAGNGLLNAMLAPLLGLNLTVRQSLQAVLLSFALISVILASFSPVVLFLIWNAPSMSADLDSAARAFSLIKVTQAAVIACAGVAANVRLVQLLRELAGSAAVARKVLFAWLAGNLFLGSQLTWILRPLFGSPHLEVQFLRANALEGNFFETLFYAMRHLLGL
ncbi:MAG TPA: hypothetical protein VLD18_16910 [Verrucomicrobiae bacterium]|nr:hypothetical protein [Verrucomicrobiae bacterium]